MTIEERDRDSIEGTCAACGREIGSAAERSYAFGVGGQLCWSCALERGGRYDAELDRWERVPDLSGLPDEAYGASPHEMRRGRRG